MKRKCFLSILGLLSLLSLFFYAWHSKESEVEVEEEPKYATLSGIVLRGGSDQGILSSICLEAKGQMQCYSTDEDGIFFISSLSPGLCKVFAKAEGWIGRAPIEMELKAGEYKGNVVFELYRTAEIRGEIRVGDRPGSAHLEVHAHSKLWRVAEADEQGHFHLKNLPSGVLSLDIYTSGYGLFEPMELSLNPGEDRDLGRIVLFPGALITGQVLSESGTPIRAHVKAGKYRTVTDEQGIFRFSSIPGDQIEVQIKAPGYEEGWINTDFDPKSRVHLEPIVLNSLNHIDVFCMDESQTPLSGVEIYLSKGPGQEPFFEGQCDGHLSIEKVDAGPFYLWAEHGIFERPKPQWVYAGQEVSCIFGEPSRLRGKVLSPEGTEVQRFVLSLYRCNAHFEPKLFPKAQAEQSKAFTDKGGRFEWTHLSRGEYCIQVMAHGYAPTWSSRFQIEAGKVQDLDIVLKAGGSIWGTLVDQKTGDPIAHAYVQIDWKKKGIGDHVFSNERGEFQLEGLPQSRISLRIHAEGYLSHLESGIVVHPGETRTLNISLLPVSEGKKGGLDLVGVGMTLKGLPDGKVIIAYVLPDSPAEGQELRQGDQLLSIDGQSVQKMSMPEIIESIRGEEETVVTLEIEGQNGVRRKVKLHRRRVVSEW